MLDSSQHLKVGNNPSVDLPIWSINHPESSTHLLILIDQAGRMEPYRNRYQKLESNESTWCSMPHGEIRNHRNQKSEIEIEIEIDIEIEIGNQKPEIKNRNLQKMKTSGQNGHDGWASLAASSVVPHSSPPSRSMAGAPLITCLALTCLALICPPAQIMTTYDNHHVVSSFCTGTDYLRPTSSPVRLQVPKCMRHECNHAMHAVRLECTLHAPRSMRHAPCSKADGHHMNDCTRTTSLQWQQ